MVSANGCEKMDSLIQAIISPKSSQIDRLESYQSVLKCLQEDKEIPKPFVTNASKILSVLKKDISNDNTHVAQESLHFLGVFLHCEKVLSCVDKTKLGDAFEALCNLLSQSTEKVVCTRALWCISKQKIPIIICVEKLDLLLKTIEETSKNPASASTSMELEAVRVINRFLIDIPDSMTVRIKMWARRLYLATVHVSAKVREAAFVALVAARQSFQKQQSDVLGTLIPDLKEVLVPGMLRLFKEKQELHSLRLWNLLLDILGRTLHQGASLINNLLAVVEKAFKSFAPEVKIAAFKAWQQLITNFGSDLDVLANPKRLRLVMQPLKANNARTEQIAFTKFKVWWHLSVTLGAKLSPNVEMVVYPLFQFCFGTIDGIAVNQSSSPGNTSMNSSSSTPKLNATLNSSTNSPSHQKYSSINRFGAEALAQILGYGLTLPVSCPSFTIASVGHHVLVPPSGFLRHSEVLMACTKEAIANLGTEKRDLHLQLYLWHALVSRIKSAAETDNRKEVSVAVTAFFRVLDDFSKSDCPSPEVMLKLLEISTLLPQRILNSSSYNIDNSSVMKGTPALFLLSLLFQPPLLKLSSSQERFMGVFKKLITSGISSTATSLGFVEEVFKTLDASAQDAEPSDILYRLWSTAVTPLLDSIQKTQEVNQGDSLEHDFRCLYSALLFPIQHLLNKPLLQNSLKTVLRIWGELYRAFSKCAALVPNVEANICVEEFCAKALSILPDSGLLEDSLFLDSLCHLLTIVVSTLDFSLSALQTLPSKILTESPEKWLKRKPKPLGNFTSLAQLLEELTGSLAKIDTKCSPSEDSNELFQKNKLCSFNATCNLVEVLRTIFVHLTSSNVIGPLASKLALSIAVLFQDLAKQDVSKVQLGQLMMKLEGMWNAASSCIQQHYTGPFDTSLLTALHPVLEATLSHPRRSIRMKSRMLWHSTFEQSYDSLIIPESLKTILKKIKPSLITVIDDAVDELAPSSMELDSQDPFTSQEETRTPQKGSFLRMIAAEQSPASHPLKSSKLGTPDVTSSKRLRLDDISEKEFVKIAPTPKRRRVLTEHQKEVFSTISNVPAMYADLSQDTVQRSSQFGDDTQTLTLDPSIPSTVLSSDKLSSVASDAVKENVEKQHFKDIPKDEEMQDSVVIVEESQVESDNIIPEAESAEVLSEKSTNDSVKIIHYEDLLKGTVSLSSSESMPDVASGDKLTDTDFEETESKNFVAHKPPEVIDLEFEELKGKNLSDDVSKHSGYSTNNGLKVSEKPSSTDSPSPKRQIGSLKSVSGEEDLISTNVGSDVRVPDLATEDEKLRSQPVLEIKRLSSRDIIELSQQSNIDNNSEDLLDIPTTESDMEVKSQEIVVSDTPTPAEIVTPKTKVKYVGKRKLSTSIITKVQSSIVDEQNEDVIPSSQNSDSSCSDMTGTRITRSKDTTIVQEIDMEPTASVADKHDDESEDIEDLGKSDDKGTGNDAVVPKKKGRSSKKVSTEVVALLSDSRITRSAAQSCGRRRMVARMPEMKRKRGRPKRKPEHLSSPLEKQTEAFKSASEESVDSETHQEEDDTDHPCSDAEISYAAQEAQEGLASYSLTNSSLESKPTLEKASSEMKSNVEESNLVIDKTRKKSKAKKRSSFPAAFSGQSPANAVRSRRRVKKSLKAILAEETSNVSKKRNSTSEAKSKTDVIKADEDENATILKDASSSLELEDIPQVIENVEIENMQLPTASIDLVKSPILNSDESEMEPVSLIVADMVEVSSKPEEVEVYVEGEVVLSTENDADHLNQAQVQISQVSSDNVLDDELFALDSQISDKSKLSLGGNDESGMEVDHTEPVSVETSMREETLEESIDAVVNSCPDMFDEDKTEISLTEKMDLVEEPTASAVPPEVTISKSVSAEVCSNVEPSLISSSSLITSSDTASNEPVSDIVNYEIEINSVNTLHKSKEPAKTEKPNKLPSASKAKVERSKARASKSTRSSADASKPSTTSSRGGRKQSITKKRSSTSPTPKKNLLRNLKPEDDNFKFVAQRNTKTYSREFHSQPKSPPITAEPSPSTNKPTNVSPLMQRTGSRALKMLEAAAKNNLSKYEKMKYEQHRSPDKSSSDERTVSTDNKTEPNRGVQSISSPQGSKSSSITSGSPAISPSGGILKKYGTFPSLSTPSPVNKRRVSFADPLVQHKDEEWQQQSSRVTVNRCLEMNQALPGDSMELQESGSDLLQAEESSNVSQSSEIKENDKIEIKTSNEAAELVTPVSSESTDVPEPNKNISDSVVDVPQESKYEEVPNKSEDSAVNELLTPQDHDLKVVVNKNEVAVIGKEVTSSTLISNGEKETPSLRTEHEDAVLQSEIQQTVVTVAETQETALLLNEGEEAAVVNVEGQDSARFDLNNKTESKLQSKVCEKEVRHSKTDDPTGAPLETEEVTIVDEFRNEKKPSDDVNQSSTNLVSNGQSIALSNVSNIEPDVNEPMLLRSKTVEKDSSSQVALSSVNEDKTLPSLDVQVTESESSDSTSRLIEHQQSSVDMKVSDNESVSSVAESVLPYQECAVDVEMAEVTAIEIPISSETAVQSNVDLHKSIECANIAGDGEIVESVSINEVVAEEEKSADIAEVDPTILKTDTVLSDDGKTPLDEQQLEKLNEFPVKAISSDEEVMVDSGPKLSPTLKRIHVEEATSEHSLSTVTTKDVSDDGEPEVKRRRVDLFQLTDDLCSLFTNENLSTLSGQKIMTLQERLCSMNMALTSSLLKRSTDIQHAQIPD